MHKISIERLSKDTKLPVEDIARLAGISEARNLGKWAQEKPNGSRPNYNAIVRLLRHGATVETLFGVDYDALHPQAQANSASEPDNTPIDYSDPKFQEGFEKTLADMKARGMIKDEVAKTIAEMKANGEL